MENKKKTVILVPGSLYLFWANGLYYLWELSKNYRIVLIVDESYSNDEIFLKSVELTDVIEVVYLPPMRNSYSLHRVYYRELKRIVSQYQPVMIMQYNDVYINNIYLFHMKAILGTDCKRIVFQNGKMPLDWEEDFKMRVSSAITSVKGSFRTRAPLRLKQWWLRLSHLLEKYKTYYLLPLLVAGRPFQPVLDLYSGRFEYSGCDLENMNRERFDYYLAYYKVEKEKMESLQGYSGDIHLITHPISTVGNECNKAIYNLEAENLISIFPSYGFVNQLSIKNGISTEKIVEAVSDKWVAVIKTLTQKFPGSTIVWKLHPGAADDPMMLDISRRIKSRCEYLNILPAPENAHLWAIKSKIVVTDVSTIFWWSVMLQNKIVISLDCFGYPNGDEAKFYDGVLYFRTLEQLSSFDFNLPVESKKKEPDLPSLTDISARLIAIY